MKAYILKITFEDITPLVWRRIILPAGATFNRLHETIQYATNFQSEVSPYHSFGVEIEDNSITNNEAIIDEYKGKKYVGRMVKQPTRIKIDSFLEKYGQFIYNYDFGDDWCICVKLEETVEDYYFGYPTLLDGEGTAPPEDVGGPPGYEEFLKVFQDPTHPDYLRTYAWAEEQLYLPLDIDKINEHLKSVKYKKTEWQYIDHDNYFVLSDKYRSPDWIDLDALPNKDLLIQYAVACVNLYGIIKYPKFMEIYNSQNTHVSSSELLDLLSNPLYEKKLKNENILVYRNALIHKTMEELEDQTRLIQSVVGKPFYVPEKKELLRYTDEFYFEKTSHQEKLAKMLAKDFLGGSKVTVKKEIKGLVLELQVVNANVQQVLQKFLTRFEMKDMEQLNQYAQVIFDIANNTRIWENRGHTPEELFQMEKHYLKPMPSTFLNVIDGGKTGRNDPCTCGSGKKYKKCCGK
ncbi:plasmid pRiA4b ORF-3 family protein [Psychrobacillus sp. L4]|uniref:plasmid pRiA4b ORF-3 family protein n=1 Tax=Psychrobacillus sp. L4 TaxID=3236892 RepID=UPI0036F1F884